MGQGLWVDPISGIAHRKHDIITRPEIDVMAGKFAVENHLGGLDCYLSALRHGIASVDDQIDEDLLNLCLIGFHFTQVRM